MNKGITNNQLAEGIERINSRFDGLENRFDGLENQLSEFKNEFDHFSLITKQEFDKLNSKTDRNWQEIMDTNDHVVRLDREVRSENAAHRSRFERLENHCGI